jgi:hypothetical protein
MAGIFDEPSRKALPKNAELADHRVAALKGAISAIPFAGGLLAEELSMLLATPLAQRRDDWLEDLSRRLHDLERRADGFRFEDLSNNQAFVSAAAQAAQAVVRTHAKEKRDALRNAVLNTALSRGGDDDRRALFLLLAERLSPLHLRILKTLDESGGTTARTAFSTFTNKVALQQGIDGKMAKLVLDDLSRYELLQRTGNQEYMTALGGRWTSAWGHDFLEFISEPVL